MNSSYIKSYFRDGNNIIITTNKRDFYGEIRQGAGLDRGKFYLRMNQHYDNDYLFHFCHINKEDAYIKCFCRPRTDNGLWPWCDSEDDVELLLKTLMLLSQNNKIYDEF